MIKKAHVLLSVCVGLCIGSTAHCDEFPYFSIPDQAGTEIVGYVLDQGRDKKEIRVFPVVSPPQTLLEKNGTARVFLSAGQFPASRAEALRRDVIKAIPDVGYNANVNGVPLRDVEFTLLIDDQVFLSKPTEGALAVGTTTVGFTIPAEDAKAVSRIMNGSYSVRMSYSARLAEFSGLNLEFTRTSLTEAYVSAFKEMISTVERSGGRFLFWDWSESVTRHSTTLKNNSRVSHESRSSLHLVLIDEQPDMLERLNDYLGLIKIHEQEFVRRHEMSLASAQAGGDAATATAYGAYLRAIKMKDPVGEVNALQAVAALGKRKILEFLENGIAFGTARGSQELSYFASSSSSVSSELEQDIREIIIRSSLVGISSYIEPRTNHYMPTVDQLVLEHPMFFRRPYFNPNPSGYLDLNFSRLGGRPEQTRRNHDFILKDFVRKDMESWLRDSIIGYNDIARFDVRFAWVAWEMKYTYQNRYLHLWKLFSAPDVRDYFGEAFYRYWIAALNIEDDVPVIDENHPSSLEDSNPPEVMPFVNSLGMRFLPVPGTEVLFSVWETRVRDYASYASSDPTVNREWRHPGIPQGPNHPVVNVSWNDAKEFCQWLTEKERREGTISDSQEYRLPTDEEWSWAVGIGDKEIWGTPSDKDRELKEVFPWGVTWPPPDDSGNYQSESTTAVGEFEGNLLGLFDLGGNVVEWCEDLYIDGWPERVLRGGSWQSYHHKGVLWSSNRFLYDPDERQNDIGFRVVLVHPE